MQLLLQKQVDTTVTTESNITHVPGTSDWCAGTVNTGGPPPPPLDCPNVWSLECLRWKNKHPWDVQFVLTFHRLLWIRGAFMCLEGGLCALFLHVTKLKEKIYQHESNPTANAHKTANEILKIRDKQTLENCIHDPRCQYSATCRNTTNLSHRLLTW